MLSAIVLVATLTSDGALRPGPSQGKKYLVHGAVTNTLLIGIRDVGVELANVERQLAKLVAPDGTFSVSLSPGSYTLAVSEKGFCPLARDILITEKDATHMLTIALLDCSDCPPMSIDFCRGAD